MLIVAIAAVLASCATAYLVGYAVVAPGEAFVRTKFGIYVLVALGLSFLFLPPQLTAMDTSVASLGTQVPSGLAASLAWPSGLGRGLYLASWIILTVASLLVGMRIWDAGKPGWRADSRGRGESSAERARGLMTLASSLEEALQTLSAANLTPRDMEVLEPNLRLAGARFSAEVPVKRSEAFSLVVRYVPTSVAARVAALLSEGAEGRRAAG
ncbi:MAG: hypothetical protein JXE06_02195 [Coriobacteriia bacterium]|nr:hypothetical protein [Coriobacteriia bacterium]MBN2821646.1 hypothetical protein [Coriobacteriia bacterium]